MESRVEVVMVHCVSAATGAYNHYVAGMTNVYTEHVISKGLQELWHNTTPDGKFQTFCDNENDATVIKQKWIAFLLEKLLHVDTHPTLTRFFLSAVALIEC